MHAKKLKASQVSGVILHDRRLSENHANEQIDAARSHLNYNLQIGDPMEIYRARLAELTFRKGEQVNTMISWVVTCPKKLVGTDDERKFFETMYDFLSERYGWKNVVSAFVHLDETTPHMHYKFIPVVIDEGIEKLNAKKVIYRTELSRVHKEAEVHCKKVFGLDKLIMNGATAGGNKTIKELKLKGLEEKFEEKTSQFEALEKKLESLESDLPDEKPLFEEKKGLLGKVVAAKEHKALINDFNELLKVERDRQRSVNLWKSRFDDEVKRFKALESDFNSFKALDLPREVLTLREANLGLKRENESLLAKVNEVESQLEAVKSELSTVIDVVNEWIENLRNVSEEFFIDVLSLIPERGRSFLSGVYAWIGRGFERD